MSNDPLFNEPQISEEIAKDPQIMAMVARARRIRGVAGVLVLVVLAAILLMTYFR